MIDITVTSRTERWECGDGCCSEYTDYFTVFFDGREVLSDFEAYDEDDAVIFALKKEGIVAFNAHDFTLVRNGQDYAKL